MPDEEPKFLLLQEEKLERELRERGSVNSFVNGDAFKKQNN